MFYVGDVQQRRGPVESGENPTSGPAMLRMGEYGVAGSCFDWKFPLSSQVDLEEAYEDDWTVWWPRDMGSNSTKNSQNTWVVVKVVITFFCF